jgi:spermidine synthase
LGLPRGAALPLAAAALLALVLGVLTVRRNGVYASELSIWEDTAAKAPDNPRARYTLGVARAAVHDDAGAIVEYRAALRLNPEYMEAHNNLGNALARSGNLPEAEVEYRAALRLAPALLETRDALGRLLAARGRPKEAVEQFALTVALDPTFAQGRFDLGQALWRLGRWAQALQHFQEAIKLAPWRAGYYDAVAWLLATHDAAHRGDGALALDYARQACALAGDGDPRWIDTLAAAEAAVGRYDQAAATAGAALQLAQTQGQADLVRAIGGRLELYRAGRPFRKMPLGTPATAPATEPGERGSASRG